jgi:hypothetical protein
MAFASMTSKNSRINWTLRLLFLKGIFT